MNTPELEQRPLRRKILIMIDLINQERYLKIMKLDILNAFYYIKLIYCIIEIYLIYTHLIEAFWLCSVGIPSDCMFFIKMKPGELFENESLSS